MKLKIKKINFEAGNTKDVIINIQDATELGQKAGERVIIKKIKSKNINNKYRVAILQISYSDAIVAPGEIGIFINTIKELEENSIVSVNPADPPDSFKFIQKKTNGEKLTSEEINSIISDSVSGHLSQIELASFITSVKINGMDLEEMTALTLAESRSGEIFNFGTEVYDKHST